MNKEKIKHLIETGKIIHFRDIFEIHRYPRYLVASAIKMNKNTFGKRVKSPERLKLKHSMAMADYFNVKRPLFSQIILNQMDRA